MKRPVYTHTHARKLELKMSLYKPSNHVGKMRYSSTHSKRRHYMDVENVSGQLQAPAVLPWKTNLGYHLNRRL